MSLVLIFLVLALVSFVLATANVASPINLQALGLAFVTLSMLVGSFPG